jgi:hypothetical protein
MFVDWLGQNMLQGPNMWGMQGEVQAARHVMFDAQEAVERKVLEEPNQMAIATADERGVPSVRMVLLKGYDARGFVFYTNYDSRKARELANGHAALCMYWEPLQRQVRPGMVTGALMFFSCGAAGLTESVVIHSEAAGLMHVDMSLCRQKCLEHVSLKRNLFRNVGISSSTKCSNQLH